jgi:hypothetical protein
MRSWLRHPQVRQLVTQEINRVIPLGDEWSAENIVVRVADGWWPELAIELDQVRYRKAGCPESLHLQFAQLALPLSLSHLLQGRLSLGTIRVHQAQVFLPAPCAAPMSLANDSSAESSAGSKGPHEMGSAQSAKSDMLAVKVHQLRQFLSQLQQSSAIGGLEIDHLDIYSPDHNQPWTLRRLGFYGLASSRRFHYEGLFQFPKWPNWPELLPQINFWGEGRADHLTAEMRGHWKEGTFSLLAELAGPPDAETLHVGSSLQNLPLFQVSEVVEKLSRSRHEMRPRLAWLSCAGELSTPVARFSAAHFVIEPCQIQGALGHILVPQMQISWDSGVRIEGMRAKLQRVSIDSLLELARATPPTRGVIANLGFLDGDLELNGRVVSYQGQISGLDLLFSNLGKRAVQRVESLQTKLQLEDGHLSGNFSDPVLRGGEAHGEASFRVSEDLGDGEFQLHFAPIRFAPEVEDLVLSGRLNGVSLVGRGRLRDHQLERLEGQLDVDAVERKDLVAKNLRVRLERAQQTSLATLEVKSLQVNRHAESTQWLEAFFTNLSAQEPLEVTHLKSNLGVSDRIFSWRGLQMTLAGRRLTFQSNGGWNDAEEMRGWVQMTQPGQAAQRWLLHGLRSDPALVATARPLSELSEEETPPQTEKVAMVGPAQPLGAQVLSQIRGWLPHFGRETGPSEAEASE